jgi:hypothetical protein
MSFSFKAGTTLNVKITKAVRRDAAKKTLERLFLRDEAISGPIEAREANFIPLPKRRGGCIWTKRVNKTHPNLVKGISAKMTATAQTLKDLNSVADFIEVSAAK